MLFGTTDKLKSEYAAVVAGSLAFAAIDSGDSIGFGMFSDKMKISVPPLSDISQYYLMLRNLVDPRMYGGPCNFDGALSHVLNSISEKSALFIVSDFIGIGDKWTDSFKAVCGKLDSVFGIMVRDVADSNLPEGVGNIRLEDPFLEGNIMTTNLAKAKKDYAREAELAEARVHREFNNVGAGFVEVSTNEPFAKLIVKYIQLVQEH